MRVALLCLLLSGCGWFSEGDAARTALEAARIACTAREWQIVPREGATAADDERDINLIRKICDGFYALMEELADAQMAENNP